MHENATAVFAIYPSRAIAEAAVDALRTEGFRNEELSVLAPERLEGIGVLARPGIDAVVAGSPMESAVAEASAGGRLTVGLVGMGFAESEAKRYEMRVRRGGILLSVHRNDQAWLTKAKNVFERTGAEDIASVGRTRAAAASLRVSPSGSTLRTSKKRF